VWNVERSRAVRKFLRAWWGRLRLQFGVLADRPVQLRDRALYAGAAKTRCNEWAGEQIVEPDTTVRMRGVPSNPEPLNAFPGGLRRAG
jgi:hypothetical protein